MKKLATCAWAVGVATLVALPLSCKKGPDLSEIPPVVVALGPTWSTPDAAQRFEPLRKYLETKLQKPFKFETFKTREAFADFVKEGKASFVFCNPLEYAEVADAAIVLAKASYPGYGSMTRGILIVKAGEAQKIRDVPAMKGASIMIISLDSPAGYLSQKIFFARNGLDLDLDFRVTRSPAGKADEVVAAVAAGQVEYGCVPFDLYPDNKPRGGAEYLTTTDNVPVDVFGFVEGGGDKMFAGQVRDTLRKIPKDDPIMKPLGLTHFALATQAEYDVITNFLTQDKIDKAQRQSLPPASAAKK
jgi:ABC-type phosphate/phosphonate transport system substrate-binding protein